MNIDAYITTELFSKDGKLLWKKKRRSESFVEAFLSILLVQFNPSVDVDNVTDTGGTERTVIENAASFNVEAGANNSGYGVVVGTGDNAVIATNYALETQVAHGITSGTLSHSAVTFGSLTVASPSVSVTILRDFTNLSGGTITIKEEGLYVYAKSDEPSTRNFCIIRDIETTGVEVADGENLRVTYTIETNI